MNSSETRPKSVFMYAAEAGVPMGLYLTVISLCLLASLKVAALPILAFPLLCGVPVVQYRLMRKVRDADARMRRLSSLWLLGIYIFIFGTLVCTLISDIYIMVFEPHFVRDYLQMALREMEGGGEQYASQIRILQEAIDSHSIPGNLQFIASMAWATCFFGSILSLLIAGLLSVRRSRSMSGF
ncbi:MAG: DUF4199 domain-containing protein [Bacteroidales bacterium]|nr:DUF4199 domain-containing protein [Bacteroidales bacterium]